MRRAVRYVLVPSQAGCWRVHRLACHDTGCCRTVHVQWIIVQKEYAFWGAPRSFNHVLEVGFIGLQSSRFVGGKVIVKDRGEVQLVVTPMPMDTVRIREAG